MVPILMLVLLLFIAKIESNFTKNEIVESSVLIDRDRHTINHPTGRNQSILYGKWSKCFRSCRQIRKRECHNDFKLCKNNAMKQRRPCTGDACRLFEFHDLFHRFYSTSNGSLYSSLHVYPLLYSIWSVWSPCARECQTHRIRICAIPKYCSDDIITQVATCYVKGSKCEEVVKAMPLNGKEKANKEWRINGIPSAIRHLKCGRPGISTAQKWTRIVGGTDTIAGKWPWQVILVDSAKEVYCGAVLISPQWLMTAAHCMKNRIIAIAGRSKIHQRRKKYEQRRKVTKLLIHPRYNKKTMDFDIALLKLKRPFKLNNKIKPVCLPSHNFTVPSGQMMTILGWGKRYFLQENATNTLQEAQVPLVSRSECKTAYKNDDVMISKNMVCGGFSDGKADSCSGDSGGPLLYKNPLTKQWFAYGITSFGAGCGLPNRYGIYALVPNVVKWIKNSIVFN